MYIYIYQFMYIIYTYIEKKHFLTQVNMLLKSIKK